MLRTLWVGLVAFVVTLIYAPSVAIVSILSSSSSGAVDTLIRQWARAIITAAGIELRVENAERVEPGKRYIILANHASYFDIPCLFVSLSQPLRFMAKASLFKIPIFGWGLRASGFIPIDRKNRKTAVKSFDLAGERIRKGNSIVIFPEEGRSRTREMRPFQRGGFLLAIKSELPIVPVAITGTYAVLPATRMSVRPGPVTIRFGHPIETAGLSLRAKDELMETTLAEISRMRSAPAHEETQA